MKKIILLLLLFLPILTTAQNKYVRPLAICELSPNKNIFNAVSANIGVLLGSQKSHRIGLLTGYRSHNENKYQGYAFSVLLSTEIKKFMIAPMFSVGENSYNDLSLRIGYQFGKNENRHFHLFASSQMRFGVGTTVKF
jgi:hypothetical protein